MEELNIFWTSHFFGQPAVGEKIGQRFRVRPVRALIRGFVVAREGNFLNIASPWAKNINVGLGAQLGMQRICKQRYPNETEGKR